MPERKRGIIGLLAGFVLCLVFCTSVFAEQPITVRLDGGKVKFDTEPRLVNDRTFVPMRTIYEAFGAKIYWNDNEKSVTSQYNGTEIYLKVGSDEMLVNGEVVELEDAPFIAEDRTLVPVRAISEALGCYVDWDEDDRIVYIRSSVEQNEVLKDVAVSDEFRYTGYDGEYNGVSIFDNYGTDFFGMELLAITPWRGEQYAAIINGMAEDLPNVRVFCGIPPTAAEFYATDPYKTNYMSAIAHIYNNLSDKVTPLNLEGAMNINLGHYLYFRTDHHWTHFGSYCAYLEFCDKSGAPFPNIDDFDVTVKEDYLGSWCKATAGTRGYNLLSMEPDRIILYEPVADYRGMSYHDMAFQKPIKEMVLLNEDFDDYNIFLEGDYPIEYFHTGNENGKSICVIKESYGNAFSTWLVNSYEDIYVVDYREFNGRGGTGDTFTVKEFYDLHPFDDLLVLSYPYSVLADDLREMIGKMWREDYTNPEQVTDYIPEETGESPEAEREEAGLGSSSAENPEDEPLPTLVPEPQSDGLIY